LTAGLAEPLLRELCARQTRPAVLGACCDALLERLCATRGWAAAAETVSPGPAASVAEEVLGALCDAAGGDGAGADPSGGTLPALQVLRWLLRADPASTSTLALAPGATLLGEAELGAARAGVELLDESGDGAVSPEVLEGSPGAVGADVGAGPWRWGSIVKSILKASKTVKKACKDRDEVRRMSVSPHTLYLPA
jgi:hypothetical protein